MGGMCSSPRARTEYERSAAVGPHRRDNAAAMFGVGKKQHIFVDTKSRIMYEARGTQLYKIVDSHVDDSSVWHNLDSPVTAGVNEIPVPQDEKGFWTKELLRWSGPLPPNPEPDDWYFTCARGKHVKCYTVDGFRSVYGGKSMCHIKGFSKSLSSAYDKEILTMLGEYDVLVWDGDHPQDDEWHKGSFTRMIEMYLDRYPKGQAVAFRFHENVPKFMSAWYKQLGGAYSKRCAVVSVDIDKDLALYGVDKEVEKYASHLPTWAHEYFSLGRVALKVTGGKKVVSMGGGGICGPELVAGIDDEVEWVVYALSRGEKEKFPTLLDVVNERPPTKYMVLRKGLDPDEKGAYKVETLE